MSSVACCPHHRVQNTWRYAGSGITTKDLFTCTQDEALGRYSVSREVPRSILKYRTVLGTLDATPKFPNIPVSLQGNTEIPGFSREVPCSALKGETVPDSLPVLGSGVLG